MNAPFKIDASRDSKAPKGKKPASVNVKAQQEELFGVPGMDGPQTVPGRAFTGIAAYQPAPGACSYIAQAPKNGSHFPVLDVCMVSQYAQERVEQIRELLIDQFGSGPLVIMPSAGGEWAQFLRSAIFQAVIDGYAALEAGIPVAIPVGATAVTEESLNAKA